MIPVFDGHNDYLQRAVAAGPDGPALWLNGDGTGHMDLPRLRAGGMVGGFFAMWIPDPETGDIHAIRGPHYRGVQFHAESILTQNGFALIHRLVRDLLVGA